MRKGNMNVTEAIESRRAVRSYSSVPVTEAEVKALLHAAIQAPSALNEQLWIFAVIQNADRLKRWSDAAKRLLLDRSFSDSKTHHYNPKLTDPSFNIFYDASTLIVIGSRERATYTDADCWLAAENMMLAAWELGLGSCPIGLAIPILNAPEVKTELGFGESAVAVAPIIVGHAHLPVSAPPRHEPRIASWVR